jgi:predicted metal-binding membrane protein
MGSSRTCIFQATVSFEPDLTSRVLGHQRLIVAAGVAFLAALAWWFVVDGAGVAGQMRMAERLPPFPALVLMWWVMMVAMMLPSATPAILLYARVRKMRNRDDRISQTWIFLAGYAAVWLLFSLAAAALQLLVTGASMALENPVAEAIVLSTAGLYQLSPLKSACLGQCRAPAQFISAHWRPGAAGAVRLGVLHGAYCVGCCWMLMALLFVGGVMNLWWVVALTLLIALEKLVNGGQWLARATGLALIAWGLALLVA